jgi:transcriptional repressor NrdR
VRCPRCGNDDDKVVDSYEAAETKPVLVVKRDGRRVPYDRAKVVAGIAKACEKRPVTLEQIETMVDRLEREIAAEYLREVPTQTIGLLILERLRDVDEVAYVRFASVYRSFQNLEEFLTELRTLQAAKDSHRER